MKYFILLLTAFSFLVINCAADEPKSAQTKTNMSATTPKIPEGAESITLGAGCFWCTEAVFQQIPGVISVTSGYMGGETKNPTYEQICTGKTGHAEVSRVVFDPKKTSLEKILQVFWNAHDPTSLNRQGGDIGTQYRSAIFYNTDAQKQVAEKSKAEAGKEFTKPIVTEITKAQEFYSAEDYHQDYYRLNKNRNPYCQMVIAPKLKKLGLKN
ncbi:peptide-methionine (S)-S-oxide reductase MsrA [Pedosphaera parvula]|uniref:Peptide methionine sulfoxide reductase MsrA n=1 Tax=Pedosphaera parvula (strain Ellin514) TaxID=320771 RepID=B9XEA2_PEDPL|nr:peptide methionine sulfoxide reductase [Pedosphaera parvula Ellin514]